MENACSIRPTRRLALTHVPINNNMYKKMGFDNIIIISVDPKTIVDSIYFPTFFQLNPLEPLRDLAK